MAYARAPELYPSDEDDVVISSSPEKSDEDDVVISSSPEKVAPAPSILADSEDDVILPEDFRAAQIARVAANYHNNHDVQEVVIDLQQLIHTPDRYAAPTVSDPDEEAEPLLGKTDQNTLSAPPFKLTLNEDPAKRPAPKSLGRRAWDRVKGVGTYIKDNPLTAVLSVFTSTQPAINAFLSPTNSSPKDISLDWWDAMPILQKGASIFVFMSSLILNIILGMVFLPQMKNDLTIANFKNHPVSTSVSLLLALCAGLALGMLAFESLSAFPMYVYATLSVFALGINFVTRFVSVKRTTERAYNFALPNPKKRVLKKVVDHLDKLSPAHTKRINQKLAEIAPRLPIPQDDKLSPEVIRLFHEELLKAAVNELSALHTAIEANPQLAALFEKEAGCSITTLKRIKNGAFTTCEITLGLTAAAMGYLIFTEKGFSGLKTLEAFAGTEYLEGLPLAAKIAIGSGSGIASAMLYFISLQDLRIALGQSISHLAVHQAEIPIAIVISIATIASAFSMYNVAVNYIGNTHALFAPITKNIPLLIEYGSSLGALGVNGLSAAKRLFSKEPDRFSDTLLEDVVDYLSNNDVFLLADKENSSLSPEEQQKAAGDKAAVKILSEFKLFSSPPASPKRGKADEMERGFAPSDVRL